MSDLTEQFSYDTLNRLVRSQLSGTGASLYRQLGLADATYA